MVCFGERQRGSAAAALYLMPFGCACYLSFVAFFGELCFCSRLVRRRRTPTLVHGTPFVVCEMHRCILTAAKNHVFPSSVAIGCVVFQVFVECSKSENGVVFVSLPCVCMAVIGTACQFILYALVSSYSIFTVER